MKKTEAWKICDSFIVDLESFFNESPPAEREKIATELCKCIASFTYDEIDNLEDVFKPLALLKKAQKELQEIIASEVNYAIGEEVAEYAKGLKNSSQK